MAYEDDEDPVGGGPNDRKNSRDNDPAESEVAADELRQLIERIERLEEEKKGIADDIKEVYAEAKGRGFDTKAMRTIVRLRNKPPQEREEEEAILELYKQVLGMA